MKKIIATTTMKHGDLEKLILSMKFFNIYIKQSELNEN